MPWPPSSRRRRGGPGEREPAAGGPQVAWDDYVRHHRRHRRGRRPARPSRRAAPARVPRLRLGGGCPGGRRRGLAGPGRRRQRRRSPRSPSSRPTRRRVTRRRSGTPAGPPTGSPTEENAHPHVDCTGRLALIHNGIIENHAELRAELVARGHTMASATDTEVMVHLIEARDGGGRSLAEATRAVLRRLRGSFSIAVISADEPDTIVAACRLDAAGAGARGRQAPARLGHPGAHRAHAAHLHAGRRPAGGADARRTGA